LDQEAELNDTQAALAAANAAIIQQATQPAAPVPPAPKPPKLSETKEFDGNSEKVNDFLHACNLYFESHPAISDKSKIVYALSFMTLGSAQTWSQA